MLWFLVCFVLAFALFHLLGCNTKRTGKSRSRNQKPWHGHVSVCNQITLFHILTTALCSFSDPCTAVHLPSGRDLAGTHKKLCASSTSYLFYGCSRRHLDVGVNCPAMQASCYDRLPCGSLSSLHSSISAGHQHTRTNPPVWAPYRFLRNSFLSLTCVSAHRGRHNCCCRHGSSID